MRLTSRFFILVGTLLLAVAASAFAGYRALNSLDAALGRVVDADMQRFLAITHARRVFRSMTVLERDYILARTPAEREGSEAKITKLGGELVEHLDHYQALMPAEDAPRVEAIRGVRQRWLERDGAVLAAALVDRDRAQSLAQLHSADPVSWEKEIGELVKLSESRLAAQVQHTHGVAHGARITLALVSGIAALIAVGLGSLILAAMRRNVADVVRLNTNLEGLVAERTSALDERERSLRLVLDSTGDGFVIVDLTGTIQGECSRSAKLWFGETRPGLRIAEYLEPEDPARRLELELAFCQLAEDLLPWEVSLEQLPKRLRRGDQILELDLRQVFEGDRFVKMLVIARNVTERVRGEDAERNAREQHAVIAKLLADKTGFAQFVTDTEHLIEALLAETNDGVLRRDLHTLKGNVALFGMQSLADACHALEDEMAMGEQRPRPDHLHRLQAAWRARLKEIDGFLHSARTGVVEVTTEDHARLLRSIAERRDYDELLALVEGWTWTPTLDVLTRLRGQAEFLSKKLEKPIQVSINDNGVRIPPSYLQKLWPTLVHVIRNAVDHGIEPESERRARGKPAEGRLTFMTVQAEREFVLEISDDGPGLDRDALLRRAQKLGIGLPQGTASEMLIFEDGLSTRDTVTELSGRGIGLSATRDACLAEGGRVEVFSAAGRGTTLRFRFPRTWKASGVHPESGTRTTLAPASNARAALAR